MQLTEYVHTFGQWLKAKHGQRVHKIAINAEFTCPNRDGAKGIGGCSFCNNSSFNPNSRQPDPVIEQVDHGRAVILKRTKAPMYLAYFQAYTNTYADVNDLKRIYDAALAQPGVIGLSVGTRPDCVPDGVLDLFAEYLAQGKEVWLELGLQSSFDATLDRVNRGHGFAEYRDAIQRARSRGIPVCTHLIVGLPGETGWHNRVTLERVLEEGTDGLKLHPLHVVKQTRLANEWKRGEYQPWTMEQYIETAADMIEMTPWEIIYHRVTGTASLDILLAPEWCNHKWKVLNGIEEELRRRGSKQGQPGRLIERSASNGDAT